VVAITALIVMRGMVDAHTGKASVKTPDRIAQQSALAQRHDASGTAEAVIYLTSHDVEGFRNERLFNFFQANGVVNAEQRTKLAFACLLTAVGIPQILAGEEFADQHDLFDQHGQVTQAGGKQVDPVDYSRLTDDWRARIKDYVARLIKFRTTSDALAVNDTSFIHVDLDGKQVLAWQRGQPGSDQVVVVVANFSDFTTPPSPSAEYVVHNWPATGPGRRWREITQPLAGCNEREPVR
jgi:pullulanase